MPNVKLSNLLHLHFIVFIWGFTAILGELISIKATPLVWFRMSIASLFILAYILYKKLSLKITFKQVVHYLIGGVIIAVHWITFFYAIKISNVSIALATMSTGAFFTVFIEAIIKKRRIKTLEFIFGIMAIIGLFIIYSSAISLQWGILFALVSSFLSALFSVLNADFVKQEHPAVISFYEILFGVIAVSLYLFYEGKIFDPTFFQLQLTDWLWLLVLSSICTAYAFIASVDLLKVLTPFTVMLTINLEPIYAIVLAFLILNESMPPLFYAGAILILTTVVANGFLKMKKNKNKG
ncbi:DMT family transporter [Pseudofulvibacter geojedonensis]|uniref:DMT family transporter n=1 Tax=Pseudofulvibacter geojedonensis TaxID=1123758 RepID=A0ABW3HY99_9FLAO